MVPSPLPEQSHHSVSVCSVQGGRAYMEDEAFVSQTHDFAAVFDGHGGSAVSRYLRQNLYAHLQASLPLTHSDTNSQDSTTSTVATTDEPPLSTSTSSEQQQQHTPYSVSQYQQAMILALSKVDAEVQRISHWSFQGSTALLAWIHQDRSTGNQTLIVANVGDSRAVLGRHNHGALNLSRDHKPSTRSERKRIERVGGKVVWCGKTDARGKPVRHRGVYRVNGNLAVSRAIGDRSERPAVSAEPDTMVLPIQPTDRFVVLASDGLWDVMSSNDVVRFVEKKLNGECKGMEWNGHGRLVMDEVVGLVLESNSVQSCMRTHSFLSFSFVPDILTQRLCILLFHITQSINRNEKSRRAVKVTTIHVQLCRR